jgi:hypothetical protein
MFEKYNRHPLKKNNRDESDRRDNIDFELSKLEMKTN